MTTIYKGNNNCQKLLTIFLMIVTYLRMFGHIFPTFDCIQFVGLSHSSAPGSLISFKDFLLASCLFYLSKSCSCKLDKLLSNPETHGEDSRINIGQHKYYIDQLGDFPRLLKPNPYSIQPHKKQPS